MKECIQFHCNMLHTESKLEGKISSCVQKKALVLQANAIKICIKKYFSQI